MAIFFLFMFVINILTCTKVRCADHCKTHADCKGSSFFRYCCGGYLSFGSKDRSCTYSSCLYRYCSTDNDCGDPSMCCRSSRCVNKGCSGCTKNEDCYGRQVCCKNTFPLHQTVCASSCINLPCNSNNDCAGWWECTGQYCCKKRKWYELSECSADCIGKSCNTSEGCGGPSEICNANNRCESSVKVILGQYAPCPTKTVTSSTTSTASNSDTSRTSSTSRTSRTSSSLPPWQIALVTISLVVFVTSVALLATVFWYAKKKRLLNSNHASNSVPLQNNRYGIQNGQPNAAAGNLHTSAPHNQMQHLNATHLANEPHIPSGHLQATYEVPSSPYQNLPIQNQQPGNGNHGFHMSPTTYDDNVALPSNPSQSNQEISQPYENLPRQPLYHTLDGLEHSTQATHFEENGNPQNYPQNPPPYYSQYESK